MSFIPRDYQLTGAQWLKEVKRGLLADDAGTGKTETSSIASTKPVLIACPTYLIPNWHRHIINQFNEDSVAVATGSVTKREEAIARRAQWTIVNHEMFRTYKFPVGFYKTAIVDESHHFKGHTAAQSKNFKKFAKDIENVYLLTASPIKKDVGDLFMQLSILDPEKFTSYNKFIQEFCNIEVTPWAVKIIGISNPEKLKEVLNKYILRRTYKEIGLSLPDLIENTIYVETSNEFKRIYKQVKDSYALVVEGEKFDAVAASQILHILRQLCSSMDKLAALNGLLEDMDEDEGCVIFTQYIETAHFLNRELKIPFITGEMSADDRAYEAQRNKIVACTIHSMSEGVDLSDKKNVIYFECDYTPGSMDQSLWRAWRHSSNDEVPVKVNYLIIPHTVDEVVYKITKGRGSDAKSILRTEYES